MMKSEQSIWVQPVTDIDTLLKWRREVLGVVFDQEPDEALLEANRQYYLDMIRSGEHFALEALVDRQPAGCGSVCLSRELPSPDNPSGRCAYLMNIYTRPRFRAMGVARTIVNRLVEIGREHGCDKIYLETTDMGRSLYQEAGFRPLPGIMKYSE